MKTTQPVENPVKTYSGGIRALEGASLAVAEGEIHTIAGLTGPAKPPL